jgi:type I restriction enzyme S subunit
MELKKYKLNECCEILAGGTPSTKINDYWDGDIPWLSVKDFGSVNKWVSETEKKITKSGFDNCPSSLLHKGDLILSARGTVGKTAMVDKDMAFNQSCFGLRANKDIITTDYLFYWFLNNQQIFKSAQQGNVFKSVTLDFFDKTYAKIPSIETQQKIGVVLSALDDKIALNRRINAKLEQMAKRLYDHWFVQFDFPNADGKPYKSSGGKMEYNEVLKREIPAGWEVKSISSLIKENIGGDWGKEELTGNYQLKVSCCRGADIESMTDLPTRYILNSNSSKLLEENDMVVEISGGSPTQSTGRCILISKEILNSFDNKLICSNFCQALSISEKDYVSYFYHMWKMFYDSDIFFNFEGKTSGIKNFQYDTFVAQKWYFPPDKLAKQFGEIASKNYKMKCALDKENKQLTSLRDRLLPLLMNGQLEVK